MEVLLILVLLVGLALLAVGVAFMSLTWTTLKTHRAAMSALQQKLARESLTEQQARRTAASPTPPSGEPRWTGPGPGGQF